MALLPHPIIFKELFKRQNKRLLYSITCIKRYKLSFYLVMFKKKKKTNKDSFSHPNLFTFMENRVYLHPQQRAGHHSPQPCSCSCYYSGTGNENKERKKPQSAEWCPDNIQRKSTYFPLITNTCHSNRLSYMALNICTLG